jgi:rare lipoprotein A
VARDHRVLAIVCTALLAGCGGVAYAQDISTGISSWYGAYHQGRLMADGCRFDMHALSAASRTIPLQAWIRVTDLKNGKAAVLQVHDRGPYVRGRILDLSLAAADKLDFLAAGLALVSIEIIHLEKPRRC